MQVENTRSLKDSTSKGCIVNVIIPTNLVCVLMIGMICTHFSYLGLVVSLPFICIHSWTIQGIEILSCGLWYTLLTIVDLDIYLITRYTTRRDIVTRCVIK